MSPRSLSAVRVAAGAAAAAVLAVLAPVLPAAAEEEACAHAREDGTCALVLTGVPGTSALRADGPWLEVPGRDPDCRTGDGAPVEVVPGDDGVFHLAPGAETVHCDVTALAWGEEAAERPGAEPGGTGGAAPDEPADPSGAPGVPGDGGGPEDVGRAEPTAVPGPADPSGAVETPGTAGDGGEPGVVAQEEHGGASGDAGGQEPPADPAPSASPSSSPAPECLGGAGGHDDSREGQSSAGRNGICGGTPLAQWPDLGAAAEQAAQLAFADLADRLGVSVFDLAEWLGVDGVRGLSRRTVDELAAMLGITPRELVERAEEEAAAELAEEVAAALVPGGGLLGRPARLPDTGPRADVLVHAGVLLTTVGALMLLSTRRRLPA
ncbi:hypothetical protein [Nocardiopsis sp. CC223A]|uniref:hypothetical protein n=1 Tax=Nocardiopsis sp. CC223A TaxID=3044051 RepID=UPI00278BF65B|nr:hypothetical protein [Nocardiopsis sp. CC223A]